MLKRYFIISCRILLFILVVTTSCVPAFGQLKANFSASIREDCSPLIVNFKDSSSGSPTHWKWDLGNGTISYLQNPGATYFNPGKYTIKLVISDATSKDSIVKTNYIVVHGAPSIDFSASETEGCFPLTVQFTDLSATTDEAVTQWEWFFGDGGYDTNKNPVHTYETSGNFDVTLRLTTTFGCQNTFTRIGLIHTPKGVNADFDYNQPGSCRAPAMINFTNKSKGIGNITYVWRFGDGETSTEINPTHRYVKEGVFTVTLVANTNDGCLDSVVKADAISIGNINAEFTAPDSVCAGTPFQLTNISTPDPIGATWTFGDNTSSTELNPTKTYAAPGLYTITLTSNFGACKDTYTKQVKALQVPVSDFTASNNTGCKAPLSVAFTPASTNGNTYQWLFGDGSSSTESSPTHVYTSEGAFDVTLITFGINGCPDTVVKKAFVNISPTVVTLNNGAEGCAPVSFKPAITVNSSFPITDYLWDFGDGTTSTNASPTHLYSDTGVYTVKLTYATGNCTNTVEFPGAVQVGKKPTPMFDASPRAACAFTTIKFIDQSTGAPIDSWLWDFGDGSNAAAPNPGHNYNSVGDFDITLTVSHHGCPNTLKMPKFIHINPPIAKFAIAFQCALPYERKFTDQSIGAQRWAWDFGDGESSTTPSPTHTYKTPGVYSVSLTVTNDQCSHTFIQSLNVIDEHADFTASDTFTCKKDKVQFSAVNVNPQNISKYLWNFGDGFTSNVASPVKIYTSPADYNVRLTITDILGCSSSLLKPLYVTVHGATADFSAPASGICNNTSITFTDESTTDGLNPITSWTWNFGDGTSQVFSAPPFTHRYTTSGVYSVSLTITDAKGCVDSATKQNILSVEQPLANFVASDSLLCSNNTVEFTNLSAKGNAPVYAWDFGDNTTSSDAFPTHTYINEGTYTVSLKITDGFGCTDSLKKIDYINIKDPVAAFSVNNTLADCPPFVASFNNTSKNYASLEWTFGNGDKSTMVNPVYIYTYPGKYNVQLTVKGYGTTCTSVANASITVLGPKGTFKYDPKTGCAPFDVTFTALPEAGFKVNYVWDFDDGTVIAQGDSITTHTFTDAKNYLPKMILVDERDCRVPVQGKDTIFVYGVTTAFDNQHSLLCDSGIVNFQDQSITNDIISNYKWTFGDGATSASQNASHVYTKPGEYMVKLVTITQNGCKDSTTAPVPISVYKGADIGIQGPDSACVPASLTYNGLNAIDTMKLTWHWDFGNGQTSTLQNPNPVAYTIANDYSVQLIAANAAGCKDTATKALVINPLPDIDAGANTSICLSTATTLHATGGIAYSWQPALGLSCTDCSDPVANPSQTTVYYVTGKNIHGCSKTDSIRVDVKQPIDLKLSPLKDSVCKGAATQLVASGAEIYQWSPADGLSNTQIADPVARPQQTTTYQVIGTDDKGCFADTTSAMVVVFPIPVVKAGDDVTIPAGNTVNLHAEVSDDVVSVLWQPPAGLSCINCKDPIATPKQTTTYSVTATNDGGCYSIDQVNIVVTCKEGNVFLPNTFSPNNNGVNDRFYPRGKGLYAIKSMVIFNRWGQTVFSMKDFNANEADKGWDGNFNGKIADEGVYVYMVEIICENSQIVLLKGNVALIR